jgi:two-component system LytT family response regulator
VDDEALARRKVRDFLNPHSDFGVIAECGAGNEAVEAIVNLRPQVVFLDIRIPELDGFQVLHQVAPQFIPEIVFVTAYDEYAVRAFEVHAFDYLLKPFTRSRFDDVVLRLRSRLESPERAPKTRFLDLIRQSFPAGQASDRLIVKSNGRIVLLEISTIEWIEAQGDYVLIHTNRQKYFTRETMHFMETQLKPHKFVRIHRSAIVNLNSIAQMQPIWSGDYKVTLRSGASLTWSRTFRPRQHRALLTTS